MPRASRIAAIASPPGALLLVGSLFGVLFVFLTPPFQVPDEPQHFYRAFQVSELHLLAPVTFHRDPATGAFHPGALLPRSLARLVDRSGVATIRFQPDRKVTPSAYLTSLRAPLEAGDREHVPVTPYSPLGYLPHALGIGLGRILGLSPIALLYVARLCALGAWLGLVLLAIRITPILRWTSVLLALMPMTLYLAASSSMDGVMIGVSFLVTARLLSWAFDAGKERLGPADGACLVAMSLGLALLKPPYLLLMGLFLLVPRHKLGGPARYWLTFGAVVASGAAAALAWHLTTQWAPTTGVSFDLWRHGVDGALLPDISPRRQLGFILSHPLGFVRALGATFALAGTFYLYSFVGALGWLDTALPVWLPWSYVTVLVVVSLLDGGEVRLDWRARCLSVGLAALIVLVILVQFYMAMSSVGMNLVLGFQGRYLIPLAPAFFLALAGRVTRGPVARPLAVALIGFLVLTSAVAASRLVTRFYVPEAPRSGPRSGSPLAAVNRG